MTEATSEQQIPSEFDETLRVAGGFRRFVGFWIDALAAGLIAQIFLALSGTITAIDRAFAPLLYISLGVGFAVFLYVTLRHRGFLGKYGLTMRVVAANYQKPSVRQMLIRTLTLTIWPIDGLIMFTSKERQRLGDQFAGTRVVLLNNRRRTKLARLGISLGGMTLAFVLVLQLWTPAAAGTVVFRSLEQAIVDNPKITVEGKSVERLEPPRSFAVKNDNARIVARATVSDHQYCLEILAHQTEDGWAIESVRTLSGPPSRSYSIEN